MCETPETRDWIEKQRWWKNKLGYTQSETEKQEKLFKKWREEEQEQEYREIMEASGHGSETTNDQD